MVKRVTVAVGIFFVLLGVLMLPTIIAVYRSLTRDEATGVGFVMGSPGENVFRVVVLLVLASIAFWLSGKLIRP